MSLLKWLGIDLVSLLLLLAALTICSRWRWAGLTAQLVARLEAARVTPQPSGFDPRELDALPPPVQRYFRAALTDGQAMVAAVDIDHRGTFNLSESGEQWKPFTSHQRVVTRKPGFVWDARTAVLLGMAVHVHDAYVGGVGILHPAIWGLFSLTELKGGGEIARGELMRFFAEAAWYPTALLPSQGVRWQAVDDASAQATLTDGALSLTLLFRFGADGLIESVRAEARGRTLGGRIVMTPWEGRWAGYELRDDMRVPQSGEVAWLTPEGRKPYWRGTITRLRYEWANGAKP